MKPIEKIINNVGADWQLFFKNTGWKELSHDVTWVSAKECSGSIWDSALNGISFRVLK